MTIEQIKEFIDNHYEITINERVKLTLLEGEILHGYFKRHSESDSIHTDKLNEKNKWEFFIIPSQNRLPQEALILDGEEIVTLELVEN